MKTISQLSEKCQKCQRVNVCGKKRMEACAYMEMPDTILAPASFSAADYASMEALEKHDYRDIKIGSTTITLDLEEVKKQLERDIYKAFGGPCLEFGA